MKKSLFTYFLDGCILAIEDQYGPDPVTLDLEEVLLEIEQERGTLAGYLIIWRDTKGIWDGLTYRNQKIGMYPLGTSTYEGAKEKLASLSENDRRDRTFTHDSIQDVEWVTE